MLKAEKLLKWESEQPKSLPGRASSACGRVKSERQRAAMAEREKNKVEEAKRQAEESLKHED